MIVGALGSDAGGADVGAAYIFFGGTAMDSIADVILTGEAADDWFGFSVSSAGDVNGDGFSDVIVGAFQNDAGGTDAGRAYIYFGGTAMDSIADVILDGEAAGDRFGESVSSAGDVNGDGFSDVIVGAPHFVCPDTLVVGRAYINPHLAPDPDPDPTVVADDPANGCFIATAAFGTPMAEEIKVLSRFRDEYLLTTKLGKRFVTFYEHHSPKIAEFISEREWAKTLVRIALWPAVKIAEFVVD